MTNIFLSQVEWFLHLKELYLHLWEDFKESWLESYHSKFDPYINVDPGTMNPYQHGESFRY